MAAGATAADKMAELIGNAGEVAVIVHDQTSRTGIDRRDGFLNEMKEKHPNIKIVSVQYGAGDHLKSAEIAKADIQANPNLKGIFGANEGSAEGAAIGVKELGKKLVLIGFDAGKEQKDAIRSGLMAGAITQNPIGIGKCTVEFGGQGAEGRDAAEGGRHRLLLVRQDQHRRSEDRRASLRLRGAEKGEGLRPFPTGGLRTVTRATGGSAMASGDRRDDGNFVGPGNPTIEPSSLGPLGFANGAGAWIDFGKIERRTTMKHEQAISATVTGNDQQVGFRAMVMKQAIQYNLAGTAENEPRRSCAVYASRRRKAAKPCNRGD